MADPFKRLGLVAGVILIGGAGLLMLPLMKLRVAQRPARVPSTALYGAGQAENYWIDCPNVTSPTLYYCTVYSGDGHNTLVRGVFQESPDAAPGRVAYDGSKIHWKSGAVLSPLQLDCVAGGRPPEVPDCGSRVR